MRRMTDASVPFSALLPHPDTPIGCVRRLEARVELTADGALGLEYVLDAELQRVRIPSPAQGGGRADRLWTHTCFEAFIAAHDSPGYLELNFSPSGQWAAYRFDSYRHGMAAAELSATPGLWVHQSQRQLQLQATVRMAIAGTLRLGLSAVVEDDGGRLSYWALRHPPGRPDFHHPDSFSFALESPRNPPP
jgi:hypothetical protein